jgi:large subunit ribosomal protein L35
MGKKAELAGLAEFAGEGRGKSGVTIYWLRPERAGKSLSSGPSGAINSCSSRKYLQNQEKKTKMPKLKTHSGAAKRFSKTGTGKIKRGHTKTRHILTSKAPKTKRKLGKSVIVSDGDHAKVARMIPYA